MLRSPRKHLLVKAKAVSLAPSPPTALHDEDTIPTIATCGDCWFLGCTCLVIAHRLCPCSASLGVPLVSQTVSLCTPPARGSIRLFVPRGPQKALLGPGGLFRSGLRCTVGPRLAGMCWWCFRANSQQCWRWSGSRQKYLFR